jgi:hypothetical protein
MPSARESRAVLQLLTADALGNTKELVRRLRGTPEQQRLILLDTVPGLIGYYSQGSAALAADFYEEERELAGVAQRFTPELVIADRVVKQRRAVAWASDPLFTEGDELAAAGSALTTAKRLAEVVQLEVARPYRDTILGNRRADPQAIGWRRVTNGGCRFCQMLAARGAIYREATTRFASHPNCNCTAQPVFVGGDVGEEADVLQYVASRRSRTPEQRADLRSYLDAVYGPDSH